jgi:DNA-binding PadR family transcriptional regulator
MNDLVLLTALLRGPAYGYALKQTAGLIFGSGVAHNNVVYPLLKKFVKSDWVAQSIVPGNRGQERKQYRITEAGRKYLIEQIANFGDREAANDGAFLLRVALFDLVPKTKREEMIAARKSFLLSRVEELSALRKSGRPRSFGAVALERAEAVVQGELQWIESLQRRIRRV